MKGNFSTSFLLSQCGQYLQINIVDPLFTCTQSPHSLISNRPPDNKNCISISKDYLKDSQRSRMGIYFLHLWHCHTCLRLAAGLCPFIVMGQIITDWGTFFFPMFIRVKMGPIFQKPHIFLNILILKWHFSDKQVRGKLTLSLPQKNTPARL